MKATYWSSNKRNATPQIVRHNQRLQSLRRAAKQMEGLKKHKEAIDTTLKKV
jgi:3-methyladenine DNA glycosylase Tag